MDSKEVDCIDFKFTDNLCFSIKQKTYYYTYTYQNILSLNTQEEDCCSDIEEYPIK